MKTMPVKNAIPARQAEMSEVQKQGAVQTTGHSWDGDLQEFNNPLPNWWLWSFYATVLFAVIYWIIYPAWPVAGTYTKGVLNTITYKTDDGGEVTTHWNTRALLMKEMQEGKTARKAQEYKEKVAASSYGEILADEEMLAFTRSTAKVIFADNCAACHGSGGAGVIGLFPNLVDDAWLWGGSAADIEQTITAGRTGFMPAFKETFDEQQLDDVASYVLHLAGQEVEADAAARGRDIFQTEVGGCYYCHTKQGTGRTSQGAADLTDNIWTVANVPEAGDPETKRERVREVIAKGVTRKMPAWHDRLSDTQIKLLTVYVHELGGGQ